MNPIPLFSAKLANQGLDYNKAINRVLNRYYYILGEEVSSFEKEFAQYLNVERCVSVANGTDAIELALRALGVEKEDKVVTVANAGFYSSTAIHAIGAIPVYVDVDLTTLTMCPESLLQALNTKPKAIIVTHLYGQLANITELVSIAESAGIPLVEDCAQAHGAMRDNKLAGSFGTISCFSFYPTKNLGALGDGGAIATNNNELADAVCSLRQYGWGTKYQVSMPGGRNSRLDEMQAAILRDKLGHLDEWNSMRRHIAQRYNAAFASLPIQLPASVGADYVAHLYVLRVDNREAFRAFLAAHGISTDIHYPVIDYRQTAYAHDEMYLKNTETVTPQLVTIPCFPNLSDTDVNHIIATITHYFREQASC